MSHIQVRPIRNPLALAVARVLLGSAALVGSAGAYAQQTAPPASQEADELGTVVVTSTRREQDILDVPYNITAVSGADIEASQVFDTPELLRSIPGVGTVDRGARNAAVVNSIRIRGLNVDSSALGDYALSAVSTVSTYVGDTPIFANFLLKDVNRVEVLRGPQGTLYGSGSLGGTVRYVLNEPQLGEFTGSATGALSSVDGSDGIGWSGDLILNIPLGETLALRANISRADYPGITDYVNLYELDDDGIPVAPNGILDPEASYTSKKDADTVEIWYGRLSAKWQPNEQFDATLNFFAQEDDIGGRRQPTLGADGFGRPYGDYENGSIQLEPATRDIQLGSLEANIDLGFATLTSSTSYYDHEGDSTSENTGFYANAGFLGFYYNYPRPMASAVRTYSDRAFVQELRLVSKSEGAFDYVIGAYYQDQDLRSTQDSYLRGFKAWWDAAVPGAEAAVTGDHDFVYRRDETFTDRSLYGELTWHVSDRLHLTGGARYFDNDSHNDTLIDIPLYASLANPTDATFESSESDVLFKFNAALDLADDDLLYATVSEGYRRGGSNAVPLAGFFQEDPRWQNYDADTVTNYEVGVKGTLGEVRYDLSVFMIDWDNAQFNTATPNWAFFVVQNGAQARTSGLEMQLSGNFTDRLAYSLGYTYLDAELTEPFISPIGTPIEPDGARLPGAPENMINAALDYRMPIGERFEFGARIDGYYQSETRNALSGSALFDVELDSFQIWDASVSLSSGQWSAWLWVKNVFNDEGVTGVFTEAYMGSDPGEGYFGNGSKSLITLPRTIGMTFTARF